MTAARFEPFPLPQSEPVIIPPLGVTRLTADELRDLSEVERCSASELAAYSGESERRVQARLDALPYRSPWGAA
jgi:hypothetical protein